MEEVKRFSLYKGCRKNYLINYFEGGNVKRYCGTCDYCLSTEEFWRSAASLSNNVGCE